MNDEEKKAKQKRYNHAYTKVRMMAAKLYCMEHPTFQVTQMKELLGDEYKFRSETNGEHKAESTTTE